MRKIVLLMVVVIFVMVVKFVISGAYYDYYLQKRSLTETQLTLIDENKRAIAELEYYKSPNYLFSLKQELEMSELSPEKTVILNSSEVAEIVQFQVRNE